MGKDSRRQRKAPRFPDLVREEMNEVQKRVHDSLAEGPRGGTRGPFGPLLRSPELADRVRALSDYLRFHSSLPTRLNELAILITARFWKSEYGWYAHKPLALQGGLAESIVNELGKNKRPGGMKPDEELVYDFCTALHREHAVGDELFERAVDLLGEQRVVDLIAVSGYYTLVSMVLNTAQIPIPPGERSPWVTGKPENGEDPRGKGP